MLAVLEYIEETLSPIVVHSLELIGILIIIYGSIKALTIFFKDGMNLSNSLVKITLGEALSLSLEFKLGAEIIKTVIVRDLNELIILGFVVVLRIVLTLLIHWEVKQAVLTGDLERSGNSIQKMETSYNGVKESDKETTNE
ncbi:DUF1622 domain-containing protein [Aerococcaceae bacterium WS4759]|uniref:DUF1622 domain-containing protein n=2 Tax=Fundicoccus ignavus TaxID=2664442 RepID=A0A6I2GEK2_9LACT|nr:DUF1622 domain-containing protein [Fundicoccus ignavus]